MRMIHPFKRALMGAFAFMASGIAVPAYADGWKADSDDALLLEARLGQFRLGEGVRGYATPEGACLDLADMIMALDVPVRLDKKLRRATGWVFEERRTIQIDREANIVQIMNKKANLGATDIRDAPEGWCVSSSKLAEWLGVELKVDQANAVLTIVAPQRLPVELAIERRSRAAKMRPVAQFDLAQLPQSRTPMRGVTTPSFDVVLSAGGLRQGRNRSTSAKFSYDVYAAGEIGPIAWDARIGANRAGPPQSLRLRAYRTDPDGQLLGPLKATQVAAGDVSGYSTALVSQSGVGRGAFVTNRPVRSQQRFDVTDFRGDLPAGWDAELYRNSELMSFAGDRADGRYEFLDIPLLYGQNRFEVVLYGPQGQIKREERTVSVGADSIPPRQTWYWAGLLQDGHDLIGLSHPDIKVPGGWRATAGLERGLNTLTSVSAYGHSLLQRDGQRSHFGEIALRRSLGPTLTEISAASSFDGRMAYRAEVLGQFGRTNIEMEALIARSGFVSDRVQTGTSGLYRLGVHQTLSLGKGRSLPLYGEGRLTTFVSGARQREAFVRTSTTIGRISMTGQLDWRSQRPAQGPPPPNTLGGSLLANARFGDVRVRGESRFRLSPVARLDSLSLVGEWGGHESASGRRGNDWRAEIAYDRPERRMRAAIGWVRQFEKLAVTASLGAGTDGSVSAGLNLAFSLAADPARPGRFRVSGRPLASSGQVLATVFRDLNGDGIRQAGEPGERDVQITAGRTPVERLTDDQGHVLIDGIQPYQAVLIGVDSGSLPDPLLLPKGPGLVVHPRQAIVARVELPLVPTGEVDGTLVRADGRNLESAEIELLDPAGVVVARTRTEFDGFFLFESVPYGRYTIQVARLSAEAHQISATLKATVTVDGKRPLAKLGDLQVESAVRRAQGP